MAICSEPQGTNATQYVQIPMFPCTLQETRGCVSASPACISSNMRIHPWFGFCFHFPLFCFSSCMTKTPRDFLKELMGRRLEQARLREQEGQGISSRSHHLPAWDGSGEVLLCEDQILGELLRPHADGSNPRPGRGNVQPQG